MTSMASLACVPSTAGLGSTAGLTLSQKQVEGTRVSARGAAWGRQTQLDPLPRPPPQTSPPPSRLAAGVFRPPACSLGRN